MFIVRVACEYNHFFCKNIRAGPDEMYRVPTSSGNHGKPGKSLKKVPCMEKSWNLKNNNRIIMEKSWNFVKYYDKTTSCQKTSCRTLTKPPVAKKLPVGHTSVRLLVFWLLVVFKF